MATNPSEILRTLGFGRAKPLPELAGAALTDAIVQHAQQSMRMSRKEIYDLVQTLNANPDDRKILWAKQTFGDSELDDILRNAQDKTGLM